MHWGPVFPNYLNAQNKYCKAAVTRPPNGFYTWLRPHLMWNIELKTLNYFLRNPTHDFCYLGLVSPNFPNMPNTIKRIGKREPFC